MKELVKSINDIIENRIEENLRVVSRTLLVDLPDGKSFALSDFVAMQRDHTARQSSVLQGKNTEVLNAVNDLITNIQEFKFESKSRPVKEEAITELKLHYNKSMYEALLVSAKNSLDALKKRIGSRKKDNILGMSKPFFNVNVNVSPTGLTLSPSLDDIQGCINQSAQAVLACYKSVFDWHASAAGGEPVSFFVRITQDRAIVRVALLMTGCLEGVRQAIADYLSSLTEVCFLQCILFAWICIASTPDLIHYTRLSLAQFEWLSAVDKENTCDVFSKNNPTLDEFQAKFEKFERAEKEIEAELTKKIIGAISMNPEGVKTHYISECKEWIRRVRITTSRNVGSSDPVLCLPFTPSTPPSNHQYASVLHQKASAVLNDFTDYMRQTQVKIGREIRDHDHLNKMMSLLKGIREKEAVIELELAPIREMYDLLRKNESYCKISTEENDKTTLLETNWRKLVDQAQEKYTDLLSRQLTFKKKLIDDIAALKEDVVEVRFHFLLSSLSKKHIL
jgi:dynein heavy chain